MKVLTQEQLGSCLAAAVVGCGHGKCDDLHLQAGLRTKGALTVQPPKTDNSMRKIALSAETIELLKQEHDKHPGNPYRFPSPATGGMYHPDSVVKLHQKILKDAGLEHIRFHELRHPYVKHTTKKFSCKSRNPKPSNILRWSGIPAFSITEGADSQSNRSWTLYAISMRLPGNT